MDLPQETYVYTRQASVLAWRKGILSTVKPTPVNMKTNFLLTAAMLLGVAGTAHAQTTPTGTQHGGVVNQTTVPPINPANPATNPGTIDQRTPTTNSPTQSGVLGTIDQGTTVPQPKTAPLPGGVRSATPTSAATEAARRSTTTKPSAAPRTAPRRVTPAPAPRP